MNSWMRFLGSIRMAVPVLVSIAGVLAWGTIYEARYGTASVQRFVYQSWWFQALLAFLALNLALAALQRLPWTRKHLPFVLAHIGIILILIGGIIGGRFGVDGQLIIQEGQADKTLHLNGNVLHVRADGAGAHRMIPTRFETQAWVREPGFTVPVALDGRTLQLTVDRYYPNAAFEEEIVEDGAEENPAVRLSLAHGDDQDTFWLFARDEARFGIGWKEAHVFFFEPGGQEQLDQLTGAAPASTAARGTVSITLPGAPKPRRIDVPEALGAPQPIAGTSYRITFKDYFPDFVIGEEGLTTRSDSPNNPAVSFVLSGPEGDDGYLLFAMHPEFQSMHAFPHPIAATVRYDHPSTVALPPQSIAVVRAPGEGRLLLVMTGAGTDRTVIDAPQIGTAYPHPALGYQVTVASYAPKASVVEHVVNRGDEVRAESVHVILTEGEQTADSWVPVRGNRVLDLGGKPVTVAFGPAQRDLPFTVKVLDFRKIDYPGTQMAAGFESDVELTDPRRGLMLMRTIKMNHPLKYRGYSLFQSSFIDGPVQTTILSVRNDPGTPVVYLGFLTVIGGVVTLFLSRRKRAAHMTLEAA